MVGDVVNENEKPPPFPDEKSRGFNHCRHRRRIRVTIYINKTFCPFVPSMFSIRVLRYGTGRRGSTGNLGAHIKTAASC